MTEVHDDPLREASHAIVGIANELAAVVMATQSLQLRLIGLKPDKDAPLAPPDAPEPTPPDVRTSQAAARFAWQPALNDEWLAKANPVETARAWAAALPFVDREPSAALALARTEARLNEVHPEAMAHYRDLRSEGRDPAEAMLDSAPLFDTPSASASTRQAPAAASPHQGTRPSAATRFGRDLGLDDTAEVHLEHAPYASSASKSSRYDDVSPGVSAPAATGVPSRATASSATTTHRSIVEADDAPEMAADLDDLPLPTRAATAGEAAENLSQEELGQAKAANAEPDIAATPNVDESTLGQEAGARHTAHADNLHAEALSTAQPQSEAARAAEVAMRTFPNAHEAVDRVPRPRTPTSRPQKKRVLGRVLRRKG
jgi:hypothetical protein